jgi:DNA repair exonuclease SbcCD ATPase subunit
MPAPNQVFFLGQPIESLSRAELIEAVRELAAKQEELRRDRDRCEQSGSVAWAANQIKRLLDDRANLKEERTKTLSSFARELSNLKKEREKTLLSFARELSNLKEERARLQEEELRLLEKRNKKSSSGLVPSS